MELLDVIIIGGGPAGSTCAGILKKHGLSVLILDKAEFPRRKICAGWITPEVFQILSIPPEKYGTCYTLQPISVFIVWDSKHNAHPVDFKKVVSYGIIREEFDEYLLQKSGVNPRENCRADKIEFYKDRVVINNSFSAQMVVGAGGHFCPVAKVLGNNYRDNFTVAALESETELDAETIQRTVPCPGVPEIIYLDDLDGYAWYFSKGTYLNIGIGCLSRKNIRPLLDQFLHTLEKNNRLSKDLKGRLNPFKGHFYKIYPGNSRNITADRALLIGDSAGLAANVSGEGIRPAVISGVLAAETIINAEADYSLQSLNVYRDKISGIFGKPESYSERQSTSPLIRFIFNNYLLGTKIGRKYLIRKYFLQPGGKDLISTIK